MCNPLDVLLRVSQGVLSADEARILLGIRPGNAATRWLELLLESAAQEGTTEEKSAGG